MGSRIKAYAAAILLGAGGGVSLWYFGAPNQELFNAPDPQSKRIDALRASGSPEMLEDESVQLAERYVTAIKAGNCEDVIALTLWMQERLRSAPESDPDAKKRIRDELCASILDRTPENNNLGPLGVEDRYILSTLSNTEVVGLDEGRDDLSRPARKRVWFKVAYPSKSVAVKDEDGNALASLIVGVNVSTDGYVLKSGVRGNVDIDFDTFSYAWPSDGE